LSTLIKQLAQKKPKLCRQSYPFHVNTVVAFFDDGEERHHVSLMGRRAVRMRVIVERRKWTAGEGVALLNGWPEMESDGHTRRRTDGRTHRRRCRLLCVLRHECWTRDPHQNAVLWLRLTDAGSADAVLVFTPFQRSARLMII